MREFVEVAEGVYVLRYPVLDVNTTLVVGDGAALVVDTLSTAGQAEEMVAAVRRVTPYPWLVVNTHQHFDHAFGNATLAGADGCPIWAHEEAAAYLRERGEEMRRGIAEWYADVDPQFAAEIAAVTIVPPDRTVHLESTVDVGGRPVVLRHFGRAHTAGDLVVRIPDVDVAVLGDIIEESGPPAFDDAYPLDWPDTLAAVLPVLAESTVVVPGHGAVVGREFVAAQHEQLTAFAWLIREGHADGAAPEKVAARSPFGAEYSLPAVNRGYAELGGKD